MKNILFGILLRGIVFPIAIILIATYFQIYGYIILGPIYWVFTKRNSFDDLFSLIKYCMPYKAK